MPEFRRFTTLRGFQRGIDWRPTQLAGLSLPPSLQACSLCGGVARKTALLPCSHVLCVHCLRACQVIHESASPCCVLDGKPFSPGQQVIWKECSTQDAMSLKVMCWNANRGCDFVGPLANLPEHFEQDCAFHPAVCPRCHETVLLAHLAQHYWMGCTPALVRGRPVVWDRYPSTESSRDDVTLSTHDTLANLESRMNELVEYVRSLDAKSSLLDSSLNEATGLLRRMSTRFPASPRAGHGHRPDSVQGVVDVETDVHLRRRRGYSDSDAASSSSAFTTDASTEGTSHSHECPRSQERDMDEPCLPPSSIPRPYRRQTTQLTRCLVDARVSDRERRAFLVVFKRTKPESLSSASDFLQLYDLVKRGLELSIPETWTAKVELNSDGCYMKIVVLEENSALDVYARVDERRRTFNPWKVESVRLAHPTESSASNSTLSLFEPAWTHSRSARLKLQASGYSHYGSNRFEAMCRRGFVVGNDTVTFCVTLVRKWNVPAGHCAEDHVEPPAPLSPSET
ncbi:uncharacterized protein LOC144108895 isoform X2 [Amblyomma americanum]